MEQHAINKQTVKVNMSHEEFLETAAQHPFPN
jgi:hypothetical protein